MAKELNVVVKAVTMRNNTRNIYVANGYIYNIIGTGATAGAQLTPIDEATNAALYNALGPDDNNNIPLAASLGQMADFTQFGEEVQNNEVVKDNTAEEVQNNEVVKDNIAKEVQNNEFFKDKTYCGIYGIEGIVDFLTYCDGLDFKEYVRIGKANGNKFFAFNSEKQTNICFYSGDVYYCAIVNLARPFGETVEKTALKLFDAFEADDKDGKKDFITFRRALITISNLITKHLDN